MMHRLTFLLFLSLQELFVVRAHFSAVPNETLTGALVMADPETQSGAKDPSSLFYLFNEK